MGMSAVKTSRRPARVGADRMAEMASSSKPAGAGHDSLPVPQPAGFVFRTRDGDLQHSWCGQPLEFHGRRARLELDFYCHRCLEHVTLPECLLPSVPIDDARG